MNIEKERMEERKWEDDVTVVRDDVTVVSSVFVLIRRSCSRCFVVKGCSRAPSLLSLFVDVVYGS